MSQNSSQWSRHSLTPEEEEELQDRVVDMVHDEYEEIHEIKQVLVDLRQEAREIRQEIEIISADLRNYFDNLVLLDGLNQELQQVNAQIRINLLNLRHLIAHISTQSRPPSPQSSGTSSGISFSRSSQGSVGRRSRSSSPQSNSNCSQGCGPHAGGAGIGADQHGNLWRNNEIIRKSKFGKVVRRKMNNLRGRRNQPPLTITVPQPPQQQAPTKEVKAVQLSPKSPPRTKFGATSSKGGRLRRLKMDLLKLKLK
jgi:hypothetical protein